MTTTLRMHRTSGGVLTVGRVSPKDLFTVKATGGNWAIAIKRDMKTTQGVAVLSELTDTVLGPTSGIDCAGIAGLNIWISPPVTNAFTLSGTITCNFWASETAMTNNAAINARIWKLDALGALTLIGTSANTVELGTSSSLNTFTITPTSTSMAKGDRLIAVPFYDDSAAATMAAVANGVSFRCGGTTAGVDGDSNIVFTETFGLLETDPTGTQIFLTNTASAVATAAVDLEAWTSRGAGVQSAAVATVNGPTAAIQLTDTAGGTVVDWFTRPLSAFTLADNVLCNMRGLVAAAGGSVPVWAVEIAVVAGDGTSPTVWGIAKANDEITNTSGSEQLTDQWWVTGPDIAVSDGQRIRIRVHIDDANCGQSGNMAAAASPATLRYAGTSGGATGDSYVLFAQTLTEFVGGGGGSEDPFPYIGGGYYA